MNQPVQPSRPWFRDPRVLLAGAAGAVALAVAGTGFGIASARDNTDIATSTLSAGALSVVVQSPRETVRNDQRVRMATLDPAALREQSVQVASSDPEGDQNLAIIDAQERRLRAMNEREATAFAAQMRQTQAEDGQMAREVRASSTETPTPAAYTTSNSTDTD